LEGRFFGVFFAPFPEEEILDSIAHRSLMRVNTVLRIYRNLHMG